MDHTPLEIWFWLGNTMLVGKQYQPTHNPPKIL